MKIHRGKSRIRTAISCIIALICLVGIGYSGWKIIEWKMDSNKTEEQTNIIDEAAKITEEDDGADTERIASNEPPDTPYWNYIKMKLIDVDFTELRKINHSDSKYRAELDNNGEHFPKFGRNVKRPRGVEKYHVPRGAYRQPLRDALYYSYQYGFYNLNYKHKCSDLFVILVIFKKA
jgi:hypothetical protein